jgi:hypothetical protein
VAKYIKKILLLTNKILQILFLRKSASFNSSPLLGTILVLWKPWYNNIRQPKVKDPTNKTTWKPVLY